MSWYLNRALSNFRAEVNARWPNRDKTSDGTVGDLAHQTTSSDHNPDPDGSVDAWDMDVDGVDVWTCIRAALAHESIQYVIYDGKITSRSWGLGTWRTYDGANPHDKHVHFNTRSSYENSAAPWLPGEDDDMDPRDVWYSASADCIQRYNADGTPVTSGNTHMTAGYALGFAAREVAGARRDIAAVRVEMAALRSVVESLADTLRAGGGSVDTAAILAGVDLRVTAAVAEVADELAGRLAQ